MQIYQVFFFIFFSCFIYLYIWYSISNFVFMERKKYIYSSYLLDVETRRKLRELKRIANKGKSRTDRVVTMTEIITNLINNEYDKTNSPLG